MSGVIGTLVKRVLVRNSDMNANRAKLSLLVAGGVFAACFAGTAGATFFGVKSLLGETSLVGVFILAIAWCVLAYFPARDALAIVSYRHNVSGVQCIRCSYQLKGNESGVCPECGQTIDIADVLRQVERRCAAIERQRLGLPKMRVALPAFGVIGMALGLAITPASAWFRAKLSWPSKDDFEGTQSPFAFVAGTAPSRCRRSNPIPCLQH